MIDPITIPTLIGAGSNLLSNVFGASSQNSANKTNMRIAHLNNEWSERMMQKQMDYNTEMWIKTNEYNSASAQVQRLKEAGLNPALFMGGSSAGIAAGGSSVGLPSPSTAQVSPYRYNFSGIGSSLMTAYQLEGVRKQQDAQSRFLDTQSDWYGAKAMSDIAQAFSNVRNTELRSKSQEIQNNWMDAQLGADYINKIRQNQSLEVAIHNSIKQGVLLDKQIARYDDHTNAQIADLVASTALKYSQGQLNKEQLKKVIEETQGLKLSNKEKDAIFDYIVDKSRNDSYWSTFNPRMSGLWSAIDWLKRK